MTIGLLVLTNCAKQPQAPLPPPVVAPAGILEPARYVSVAASSAQFAIRASRMAEGRASAPKLSALASKVVVDQSGISAQLGFAGRKIDLLPSSQPLPVHQAMLDELATSTDFDGTYRRQLALVLTQAEAVHRTFEERGTDPILKPVAAMAAPIYRKNLEQLRKL